MSFRARTISAQDGTSLYFRDYYHPDPHKPALLCLPGLVRNSADFTRFAERYAGGRRIIAVDYRGRGNSGWPDDKSSYHPQNMLLDLHHVLAAANCHHVIAVGTSLGGILATGLGAIMPTVLAGVVLNDIGPDLNDAGVKRIQSYVGKLAPPRNMDEAAEQMAYMFGQSFPDYGATEWRREAEITYAVDDTGAIKETYDPAVSQSVAGGAPEDIDLWALFRSLSGIPVLSIRGELSDIFLAETQDKMAAQLSSIDRLTVANRGHAPTFDEPECLAALPEFFEKCDIGKH